MRFPLKAAFLGALATALSAAAPRASAEVNSEARTPAEVYERKTKVCDCLVYVAKDLKARSEASPDAGVATLLLLVDPTASLKDEMSALRDALPAAWA